MAKFKRKTSEKAKIISSSGDEKELLYNKACELMSFGMISDLESAVKKFRQIPEWRDAEKKIAECEERIKHIKERTKKRNKIRLAALILALLLISASTVFKLVIEPNNKYHRALADKEAGRVIEAYEMLIDLNGYKDSAEQAESFYDEYKFEKLKVAKVGDCVKFGKYEQNDSTADGKEKIEWLVLEIKDNKALVISKYSLECLPYNNSTTNTDVTWESSSLRAWLNNEFLSAAFSEEELARIISAEVTADKNPTHATDQGVATEDKVFLLSIAEANKYFPANMGRRCKTTLHTRAGGIKVVEECGDWWLRSVGMSPQRAAVVSPYGAILEFGYDVGSPIYAVRPALWIELGN